jgi:hypothetical protein
VATRLPLFVLILAATVSAQPATRRATNLAALSAYPTFYHLRPIVVVGKVTLEDDGQLRVSSDGASLHVISKGPAPDGLDEIRGEFWDVGRMKADDPRLSGYDIKAIFKFDPDAAWPRPGQVTAVVASAVAAAVPPAAPNVRNIVLYPSRYVDQQVTVIGQFGGRNLLGDLPDAPAQSRYDFVLRSADAAVWVVNMRPRGKDFELALDARIDTGRWLEVSGTLRTGRGLQWLDATAGSLRLTRAPRDPTEDAQILVPPGAPPEVIFSAPTADETDVALSSSVRVQFSRDIDPATFKNRVGVKYSDAQAKERGEPATSNLEFTTQYLPGTRVLEIRFRAPFERFRAITVDLQEGILGTDRQALKPWTLAFQTGP